MGTFCVVTSSKEFRELSNKLNIHPSSLEVCVHLFLNSQYAKNYLRDNGELPFPSEEYVKEFFFGGNAAKGRLALAEWANNFGYNNGVLLERDIELAQNSASVSSKAIHTFRNSEGKRVIKVARPIIENTSQLEYFLDKLGYVRNGKLNNITEEQFRQYLKELNIPQDSAIVMTSGEVIFNQDYSDFNNTSSVNTSDLYFLKPILDELQKLMSYNEPIGRAGSNKKIKDRLKRTGVNPLISNVIMKAIELDPSLKSLTPLTIFNLISNLGNNSLAADYELYRRQPIISALEQYLIDYLKPYNINVKESGLAERLGVTGVFDILNKTIHLARNRNAITVSEEFSHAFVELMGSVKSGRPENQDFTYLMNNIESTDIYDKVFQEYKNTYTIIDKDGKKVPDLQKIRKEAIGLALAVAINNKWENKTTEKSKGFWEKLKEWFNKILDSFSHTEYININTLLDLIATEVILGDYSRLKKVDNSNYQLLDYAETVAELNKKDGGKAVEFMLWFTSIGNIITGSFSYRKQGTVYRGKADSLHDIDMKVPQSAHKIDLSSNEVLEAIRHNKRGSNHLLEYCKALDYFKKVAEKYPNLELTAAYPDNNGGITINSIYSENRELIDRFKNLSGSYSDRLSHFTEEERDLMYLFDFFLENRDGQGIIMDEDNNIRLARYEDSFKSKLEMGRAKDIFDYQMYELFDLYKSDTLSEQEYLMFQLPAGWTWNPEQRYAIDEIGKFIAEDEAKEDYFLLIGKAGTGKTTIINEIVENEIKRRRANGDESNPLIYVSAVANSAVGNLASKINVKNIKIEAGSTAAALGMTIVYNPITGQDTWIKPKNWKVTESPVYKMDICFVDECSMLTDVLVKELLLMHKANPSIKFVFLGDSGLLGPILDSDRNDDNSKRNGDLSEYGFVRKKGDSLSAIFQLPNRREAKLLQRMRLGEDNPILSIADHYWNFAHDLEPKFPSLRSVDSIIKSDGAILVLKPSEISVMNEVMPLILEGRTAKDPMKIRFVAWRNATISSINASIYGALHPEEKGKSYLPLHTGDLIMYYNANYPAALSDLDNSINQRINNGAEYIIVDASEPEEFDMQERALRILDMFPENRKLKSKYLKELPIIHIQNVTIQYRLANGEQIYATVPVVCPGDYEKYMLALNGLKNNILGLKNLVYDHYIDLGWRYEDAKGILRGIENFFGQIKLGYGITSHKAQGKTFETTVVDATDILKMGDEKNKSRSMYTAITRSSNTTIILAEGAQKTAKQTDVKFINDRIRKEKGLSIAEREELPESATPLQDEVEEVEETAESWESILKMWDGIYDYWGEHVNFVDNDEEHAYYYYPQGRSNSDAKPVKVPYTVTSLVNPVTDENDWLRVSSRIGSVADSIVRDFFQGKNILDTKYPNVTLSDLETLKEGLTKLRDWLDKMYGENGLNLKYEVRTKTLPIVFNVEEEDGTTSMCGGTPDIVVFDEDGGYMILDTKTTRKDLNHPSKKGNLAHYTSLVNSYSQGLEASHPKLKGKCRGLYLFQLKTMYATPIGLRYNKFTGTTKYTFDKNTKLIFANGEPIETASYIVGNSREKVYLAPELIDDNDIKKSIIKLSTVTPKRIVSVSADGTEKTQPMTITAVKLEENRKVDRYSISTNGAELAGEEGEDFDINFDEEEEEEVTKPAKSAPMQLSSNGAELAGEEGVDFELDMTNFYDEDDEDDLEFLKVLKEKEKLEKKLELPKPAKPTPLENYEKADKRATMNFDYDGNQREGVTSSTTIQAIANGERTSTTRYTIDANIDYWRSMEVGDIVEFHRGKVKDPNSESLLVRITKAATRLTEDTNVEEWSKKEGWSEKYFKDKVLPAIKDEENDAWQIEYEYIEGSYTGEADTNFQDNDEKPRPSKYHEKVTVSTAAYTKEDAAKDDNTARIFTENALANAEALGLTPVGPKSSKSIVLNVKDYANTDHPNLAGIRMNPDGTRNESSFGLIVKKYQLDKNGKFVALEGCFKNTDSDFKLFKEFNLAMFKRLEDSGYENVVFPALAALGKAALPKRFADWLRKQLYYRYGVHTSVVKNLNTGYNGYGIKIETAEQLEQQTINIWAGSHENEELSNFAERPFTILEAIYNADGTLDFSKITFKSVELAFLYAKLAYSGMDRLQKARVARLILSAEDGKTAKNYGSSFWIKDFDRSTWDKESSVIMKNLITESFKLNPDALQTLLDTGNATLTHTLETSDWKTKFPKLLMEVREELGKAQEEKTGTPRTKIPIKRTIISEATLHSGGAEFSDASWDIIGREYGLTLANHYREPGATEVDSKDLKKLGVKPVNVSEEDFEEGKKKATKAAKEMYNFEGSIKSHYIIRNWAQVKYSDGIFAIGTILYPGDPMSSKKDDTRVAARQVVKGGTGYAVQMAIDEHKPVHVYDASLESWFRYDYESQKFVAEDTPALTKNFAGIGTRSYANTPAANKALKAIRDVFEKTISEGFHDTTRPEYIRRKLNDIVDSDANVDWDLFEKLQKEYFESLADKRFSKDRYDLSTRPEKHERNAEQRAEQAAKGRLYEDTTIKHIKNVVKSAKEMKLPEGVDRRNLVIAALLHDIGKPFRNEDHGSDSKQVAQEMFELAEDYKTVLEAVRYHMLNSIDEKTVDMILRDVTSKGIDRDKFISLVLALNEADIRSGRDNDDIDDYFEDGRTVGQTLENEMPEKRALFLKINSAIRDEEQEEYNRAEDERLEAELHAAELRALMDRETPLDLSEAEKTLIKQRENLRTASVLTPRECNLFAKACMFMISDLITSIQTSMDNNAEAFEYLPEYLTSLKEKLMATDFTKMSRIETIREIGLNNLFAIILNTYFNKASIILRNAKNGKQTKMSLKTTKKLNLINQNFMAFTERALCLLSNIENIAVDNEDMKLMHTNDDVLFDDMTALEIEEIKGSAIETWQIGFRQISAFNSLSLLVKRNLNTLKLKDAEGNDVLNELGIPERVDAAEAVNSILEWTLGANSLSEMIAILHNKIEQYPWIKKLIDKLEGDDETFKSLFYSNFKKYFLPYIILFREKIKTPDGRTEFGPLRFKIINKDTLGLQYIDDLLVAVLDRTLPLLKSDGKINKASLRIVENTVNALNKWVNSATSDEVTEELKEDIQNALEIFNITPSKSTIDSLTSNVIEILNTNLTYILKNLKKYADVDNADYIKYNKNSLLKIFAVVADSLASVLESVSYEDGKLHYSYVTPSFLSKLTQKILGLVDANLTFTDDDGNTYTGYEAFMMKEYGQYGWFRKNGLWRIKWLLELNDNPELRTQFQHAVVLTTQTGDKKIGYRDKSPMLYAKSMLENYFAFDDKKLSKYAYYRIPIMSNKPSEEYIRFLKYTDGMNGTAGNYKEDIAEMLIEVAEQEMDRIKVCRERKDADGVALIKNFDEIKGKGGRGLKFLFIDYLLDYLDAYHNSKSNNSYTELINTRQELLEKESNNTITDQEKALLDKVEKILLGRMLEDKIEERGLADTSLYKELMMQAINKGMQEKFQEYISVLEESGLLDKDAHGKFVNLQDMKIGKKEEEIIENLENFFWNDTFAAINILEMTVTDVAYYKDAEDLQKRLAQLHAPGMRGNLEARWNGILVTDKTERTVYISDFEHVVSDAYENVKIAFLNKEKRIRDEHGNDRADEFHKMAEAILDSFQDINVTDAQGYSSPTSYRKKAIIFGKWSDELEETYLKIRSGEYDVRDLQNSILPLKPFIYSHTAKDNVDKNGDLLGSMAKMKVGMQNKNSEYLLVMADAILRGELAIQEKNGIKTPGAKPKKSLLSAIYDIMEESHYEKDGKTYRLDGIDTIQFNSTVKAGEMGVVDINSAKDAEEAKEILREAIYQDYEEGTRGSIYNNNTVHALDFEDYSLQSEVPAHLEGESIFGSLTRILGISDLPETVNGNVQMIRYRNKMVSVELLKRNYIEANKKNIEESLQQIFKEFKLDKDENGKPYSKAERNRALSRLLLDLIRKDSRYGYDLLYAVSTDEYGRFNIPLSDPIQSGRIQLLLYSIIKSRINKLQIAGGPVVLVTNFGTSSELDIVFQDKNGNRLKTLREFYAEKTKKKAPPKTAANSFGARFGHLFKNQQLSETEEEPLTFREFMSLSKYEKPGSSRHAEYLKYYKPIVDEYQKEIGSKQGSIAYFECYAPSTVFKEFADKNGFIDINKIPEDMLKVIGYRIPTEAKYSMAPLKIVGFLPMEAGEGIMLPKDITLLSGSDFDIDKLYVIRPEMYRSYDYEKAMEDWKDARGIKIDNKALWDDLHKTEGVRSAIETQQKSEYELYKQIHPEYTGTLDEYLEGPGKKVRLLDWLDKDNALKAFETALEAWNTDGRYTAREPLTTLSYREWINEKIGEDGHKRREDYFLGYKKSTKDNTAGRNNVIFDTLWAVLTSEHSTDQVFVPGNFNGPKKYGYMSEVMTMYSTKGKIRDYIKKAKGQEAFDATEKQSWYEIIDSMSIDDLKDAISKPKNLVYNHIHLNFHRQNMVAGKLIGIFAQNNVSHSVISLIDGRIIRDDHGQPVLDNITGKVKTYVPSIYIDPESTDLQITINGRTLAGEVEFDRMYTKDGRERISSSLAAFLAASVDAVKDPVLNYMNINETTAGVATTLARLGDNTEMIMLLLSLPVIKELILKFDNINEARYISMSDLIDLEVSRIQEENSDIAAADVDIPEISKEGLIKSREKKSADSDINLLRAYQRLDGISRATSSIVTLTKYNSVTSALGPLITNAYLLKMKLNKATTNPMLLTDSMKAALLNGIITSFRNAVYLASDSLFKGNMIQANTQFEHLIERLDETIKASIDDDMINKLTSFYVSFILTLTDNPIFKTDNNQKPLSKERRTYIIKELPKRVKKAKEELNSDFLTRIRVRAADSTHSNQWLSVNTRGMLGNTIDDIGLLWQELYDMELERILKEVEEGKKVIKGNLALELIEYNFNTSGLGFSPSSFASLINVAMRKVIPNYNDILDNLPIADNLDTLIDLFIRNNHYDKKMVPDLSSLNDEIIIGNSNGFMTVDIQGDPRLIGPRGAIKYFKYNGKMYRWFSGVGTSATYKEIEKLGGLKGEILEVDAKDRDILSIIDKEVYESGENPTTKKAPSAKKFKNISKNVSEQILVLLLRYIPEAELDERIKTLRKAVYSGNEYAPKSALEKLIKDAGFKPNFTEINKLGNIARVINKAIKGLTEGDIKTLREKANDIEDTIEKLNLCGG